MPTTIGLDLGSSAVRAVQLSVGGRGPATLDRVGQVMLPPGAIRDGEIHEPDAVVGAIRALWSRYGFKSKRVAVGVANQQVVVRQLELPYLPDRELRQSLQFQVQDAIPFPVEQAVLDFHTLEHYETAEGLRYSRILLVAAQKTMVTTVVDVVRRAKLKPVLLDLDAFAMLRCLAADELLEHRGGELIIDVGSHVTNLVVHQDGIPKFVRILLMGGNAITEALMSACAITFEEAETGKVHGNLDDEGSSVIAERAARFVDEIRSSVDYYGAQDDAVPVERVVLSGGASQLPQLRERLGDALGVPVDRGHPMQEIKVGAVGIPQEQLVGAEPYLATAVGLALGAAA